MPDGSGGFPLRAGTGRRQRTRKSSVQTRSWAGQRSDHADRAVPAPGSLQNDKPAVTAAAIVATAPTPTAARVPTMPRESRIASLSGTVKSSHLYRRKIELVGGLSRRCVSPAGMAEDWRFGCSAGDGSARADVRRKGGRGQGEGRAPPHGGRPSRDDGGDARRPRWNIGRI